MFLRFLCARVVVIVVGECGGGSVSGCTLVVVAVVDVTVICVCVCLLCVLYAVVVEILVLLDHERVLLRGHHNHMATGV